MGPAVLPKSLQEAKGKIANLPAKPPSTATQTASPCGVNASGSDVKVGDISCPPPVPNK